MSCRCRWIGSAFVRDLIAHGYSLIDRKLAVGVGATWRFAGTPPSLAASMHVRDSGEAFNDHKILLKRELKPYYDRAARSLGVHHIFDSPAYSCVSITLPASDTEGPRFSFWARPSLFRPPFFKSYARTGASMIAPSLPIASTGQPSIASLQS